MSGPAIDAERVIADLRELQRRTGDESGAQRLCWGEGWRRARELLAELLGEIGLSYEVDEAGNAWAYLAGTPSRRWRWDRTWTPSPMAAGWTAPSG